MRGTSYTDKQSVHISIWSMEENKNKEKIKNRTEDYPTSQRRCEIDGKRFLITRHFEGNRDLSALMTEIAISRANREMGL